MKLALKIDVDTWRGTREGVPLGSFSEVDLEEMSELLEQHEDRIVLTRTGRVLANEVALRLIDLI